MGHFGTKNGVILGSLWDHCGIVLALSCGRFDVVLITVWGHFCAFFNRLWVMFGCFRGATFGGIYCHFEVVLKCMGTYIKLCKIMPKLCTKSPKSVQNRAKTRRLSPIKHLVRLKTGQNWRFNLWKCAVSGCAWWCPEWILSFYATLLSLGDVDTAWKRAQYQAKTRPKKRGSKGAKNVV